MPAYDTIVEALFSELHVVLQNYCFDAYGALAQALRQPIALAMVVYIIGVGVSISQGWLKLSVGEFSKQAFRLGFILLAALHWSWFSQIVIGLIAHGASHLAAVLTNATPLPLPQFAGAGINGAMQSALIEFTKIGLWIWRMGSWHVLGPLLSALMVWGFGFALLLIALFELVVAKIMLALLFSMAPLFIALTLFKSTHSFFDRWLGACVGFALLQLFVAGMLALALTVAQWAIGRIYIEHAMHWTVVGFVPVMVVSFIGVGLLLKAAQFAQSIGGTVTTVSGSSMLAGALGGFLVGSWQLARQCRSKSVDHANMQPFPQADKQVIEETMVAIRLDLMTVKRGAYGSQEN